MKTIRGEMEWEKLWDKQYGKYLLKADGLTEEIKWGVSLNRSAKDFISGLILSVKSDLNSEIVKVYQEREKIQQLKQQIDNFLNTK